MRLRRLTVRHFRGIATLDWDVAQSFCCLIGAGDAGKTTVLDAIEAALTSRWWTFTEVDFFNADTGAPILIEVTVGELSRALLSDDRFGLHIRGWSKTNALNDEPEGDDEPVLTVRLTVNATLEPQWELVCDRMAETRVLSNRDRALFGMLRLSGEDARHLGWGQGSILSRLTDDKEEAAAHLATAYRTARASAKLNEVTGLCDVATKAEAFARTLGANVEHGYEPGLELGRTGLSAAAIALHDGGVPLRLAGLGTRRLAILAIQRSAILDGAIVLIDEIEHGLEPHRIVGAVRTLKADQNKALEAGASAGQVIITTHSDIALSQAGSECLVSVQVSRPGRAMRMTRLPNPADLDVVMRSASRALLARRVLVCEGTTEVGLLRGMCLPWAQAHGGVPIEQLGVALADGHGGAGQRISVALAQLGYGVALFRDTDVHLTAEQSSALIAAGVTLLEYANSVKTEHALFAAASDEQIDELVAHAQSARGDAAVESCLMEKFPGLTRQQARMGFASWSPQFGTRADTLRGMAEAACLPKGRSWFKNQDTAYGLAPTVTRIVADQQQSELALVLHRVEAWLYA